ncbi:MAG: hypothetical protein ACREL2_00765 [Gemmatimonadales bacterium]
MTISRSAALLALLAGSVAPAVRAQAGRPYPVVLVLPASVRFAGLGGAGVPVIGDAGSVFVNPAGLAAVPHLSIEGAFDRYAGTATQSMAAVALRVGQFDFGAGAHSVRFGDTAATRDNLVYTGTGVFRFGLIALGGSVKYVSVTDSARQVSSAVTGDVGTTIAIFDILALAVSVQNLGQHALANGGLDLPTTTHAGVTFNFVDPQGTLRLRGILESAWSQRGPRRTVIGAEAGVSVGGVTLTARAGFGAQPEGSGASEQSYGATIGLRRVKLDWAYQRRTVLGSDVERIGFRWTR